MDLNEYLNKGREKRYSCFGGVVILACNPLVRCKDGYSVSVQCQEHSYCYPRQNLPDVSAYTSFELGFPSEIDDTISKFAEEEDTLDTVFPYVPRSVVEELIRKHGGIEV